MNELGAVVEIMESTGLPWAICGGWAIDLFRGSVTREHKDVDVIIPRGFQLQAQRQLSDQGWALNVAHKGQLSLWKHGQTLEPPLHVVWATKDESRIEILLTDWTDVRFSYRRDPRIWSAPLQAIRFADGIPFLAPEWVLLYKSTEPENAVNKFDLAATLPILSVDATTWLTHSLTQISPEHPWIPLLTQNTAPGV